MSNRPTNTLRSRLLVGATIASVVALVGFTGAAAQDGTEVGPWPRQAYTEPDQSTTVTIHVVDVEALYGADVRFAFDPDIVQVLDADSGTSGVQIEPLDVFLSPDWVIVNSVDNTAGTIEFAVTQMNPSQPVDGTGSLAAITFEGQIAGTTPITVTYRKIVRRDGSSIDNTAVNGFLAVGPTTPTLAIAKAGTTTARLTWTESFGAESYAVYRGTNAYFAPTDPPYATTSGLSFDDAGARGDPATNYTYVVKGVSGSGYKSAASNRVGEFDYAITPGEPSGAMRYNLTGVPLQVLSVTDADSLADYVGAGVYMLMRHVAASQSIQYWLPGIPYGENFTVGVGSPTFLQVDSAASTNLSFVGGIPDPGDVSFSLTRPALGQSCLYNFITIPFEKDTITTAEGLATDIGGVYMVLKYDAPTQDMVFRLIGLQGPDFAVRAGYPYIVCLESTAPTFWP